MSHNQQNLSPGTAYARFMLGSVMTAYGTVRLLREPKSRSGKMLVLFGSMKAAEGATKFCPRKAMSTIMEKMMSENAAQGAQFIAGTAMTAGTQSGQNTSSGSVGQKNGNIMQMVGNIAQKLTGGNSAQSTSGSQNMGGNQNSSGAGQNAMGTATQTIGNIAQTVAPQISQITKNLASISGTQNASGTNNAQKQASKTSVASNNTAVTNGNANKKDASANSVDSKSATNTNTNNNKNKQATSTNSNNMAKSDTKLLQDGQVKDSNLDPSVLDAISKSGQKNTTTPNILQ